MPRFLRLVTGLLVLAWAGHAQPAVPPPTATVAAWRDALEALATQYPNGQQVELLELELLTWRTRVHTDPTLTKAVWADLHEHPLGDAKNPLTQGLAAQALGHYADAVKHYQQTIKAQPNEPALALQAAQLMLLQDDPTVVRTAFSILEKLHVSKLAALHFPFSNRRHRWTRPTVLAVIQSAASLVRRHKDQIDSNSSHWCAKITDLAAECQDDQASIQPWFDIADQVPVLALSTLPLQYHWAQVEKRDPSKLLDKAWKLVRQAAAAPSNTQYFWNANVRTLSFEISTSTENLVVPSLPEFLVRDAVANGQGPVFATQGFPLFELAFRNRDYVRTARLWTCSEQEFMDIMLDIIVWKRQTDNADSFYWPYFEPAWEVIIARKLHALVMPLMMLYMHVSDEELANPPTTFFCRFVAVLSGYTASERIHAIKQLIESCLQVPEAKWPEMLPQLVDSNDHRLNTAIIMCRQLADINAALAPELLSILRGMGLEHHRYFTSIMTEFTLDRDEHKDPQALMAQLAATSVLSDLAAFHSYGSEQSNDAGLLRSVRSTMMNSHPTFRGKFARLLAAYVNEHPTFGARLMQAALVEDALPESQFLHDYDQALGILPPTQRTRIMRTMLDLWPALGLMLKKEDTAHTLPGFVAAARELLIARAQHVLKAQQLRDLNSNALDAEGFIAESLARIIETDPELAVQIWDHGAQLMGQAPPFNTWHTRERYNGCNAHSRLLAKGCSMELPRPGISAPSSPSFAGLRFAVRLCSPPNQRQALFPGGPQSDLWANLLLGNWNQMDGYAHPRRATRSIVTAVSHAMGGQPEIVASLVFQDFVSRLPRWYADVVSDEAAIIAHDDPALSPVATQLVIAVQIFLGDWSAASSWDSLLRDPHQNPLLKAQLAGRWCEQIPSLPPATMTLCLEYILPALESDWPTNTSMLVACANAFVRQPRDETWKSQAERYRAAWLHRTRFDSRSPRDERSLRPTRDVLLPSLAIFADGRDADAMHAFAVRFTNQYENTATSRLIMARGKRPKGLRELMSAGASTLLDTKASEPLAFHERDASTLDFIESSFANDTATALRARAQAASVQDSILEPPTQPRHRRLADEASKLLQANALDNTTTLAVIQSMAAARVLAKQWLAKHPPLPTFAKALKDGSSDKDHLLQQTLTFALARLSEGDDSPWNTCVLELKTTSTLNDGGNAMKQVADLLAPICVHTLRDEGYQQQPWIERVIQDVLALTPNEKHDGNNGALAGVWLSLNLIHGESPVFHTWRSQLSVTRSDALSSTVASWLIYCLEKLPLADHEACATTFFSAVRDPWGYELVERLGDTHRPRATTERLSPSVLRAATPDLIRLLSQRPTIACLIMDAWRLSDDQETLRHALEAVPSADASPVASFGEAVRGEATKSSH